MFIPSGIYLGNQSDANKKAAVVDSGYNFIGFGYYSLTIFLVVLPSLVVRVIK